MLKYLLNIQLFCVHDIIDTSSIKFQSDCKIRRLALTVPRLRQLYSGGLNNNLYFLLYILTSTGSKKRQVQYIPRNMHTVLALLCFVVVIHWLIFPYPSGLLHWHCGNLANAPVPAKQPWWICINTSCEFIMNDCITTTKQSTTQPYAYFLGYTVCDRIGENLLRWLLLPCRCHLMSMFSG